MTTGVFPEDVAGGVVIRDAAGEPTHPDNVQNAYVPLPPFDSSCLMTALPSDCTARIEARQINAIVSELVSFAECIDPTGSWDCASLKNLCAAFVHWAELNISGVLVSDEPPTDPGENQLWWESDSGLMFIWYDDGNGTPQWVQVVGTAVEVDRVSIVGSGSSVNPLKVALIDCGVW